MILGKARIFLVLTAIQTVALAGLCLWSLDVGGERRSREIPAKRELVRSLQLTDVALWSEARYTRHPSQADFFAAFQDGPSSPEHFPAGSVVAAPTSRPPSAQGE